MCETNTCGAAKPRISLPCQGAERDAIATRRTVVPQSADAPPPSDLLEARGSRRTAQPAVGLPTHRDSLVGPSFVAEVAQSFEMLVPAGVVRELQRAGFKVELVQTGLGVPFVVKMFAKRIVLDASLDGGNPKVVAAAVGEALTRGALEPRRLLAGPRPLATHKGLRAELSYSGNPNFLQRAVLGVMARGLEALLNPGSSLSRNDPNAPAALARAFALELLGEGHGPRDAMARYAHDYLTRKVGTTAAG